jgi:membrane fusion protein (multidrug efflux system)
MSTAPANVESAAAPVAAAPAKPKANPAPIILGILALIGVAYGAERFVWGRTHVRTDNAQVEGNVVPVLARVSGYIAAIPVKENQPVQAGDVLVQIDDRELKAKLAQAEADLQGALANVSQKGRVGQIEAQEAAAQATVAQAEANARKAHDDLARYVTLSSRNVVSKQQLDGARAASEAADAGLLAARKQVQAIQASLNGANARVAALQAAKEQATLQVSFTRILAPVSGVVSRKSIDLGQFLQPGQTTMAVVPLDDVWVVANLKETEVEHVRVGDAVEVVVDAYPHHKYQGHVESVSPATGAKFSLLPPDNATGNFTKVVQRIPVRVRVDRSNDPQFPLRPGMSADITVTTK